MKIAHIAYQYGFNNVGGAAIASSRLHQALLAHGIESHYICHKANEPGRNVYELPQRGSLRRFLYYMLIRLLRYAQKIFLRRGKTVYVNIVPMFGLEKFLRKINPDVVHVQWINSDVAMFEQIGALPYPVVFSLHDLYLLLPDGSGYPVDGRYINGCSRANTDWLTFWLWRRKGRMIRRLKPVFMGPSEWVAEACAKSINGRSFPVYAISNIIGPDIYYDSSLCRSHDKFVILFGAFRGRGCRTKGWDDLVEALSLLPGKIKGHVMVEIFGEDAEDFDLNGIPVTFLGVITDPARMREVYHQADVFAFPSVQETQGMTKIEAMLCGLPVVAFNRTACAEGIVHGSSGWIANDVASFAQGLVTIFEMTRSNRINRENIAAQTAQLFRTEKIVERVEDVYERVCGRVYA